MKHSQYPAISKYPKFVKVKKAKYTIKFVDFVDGHDDDLGACWGKPEPQDGPSDKRRLIEIKSGMDRKQTFNVFMHELMHAVEFEYDLTIPHNVIRDFEDTLSLSLINNFNMKFKRKK